MIGSENEIKQRKTTEPFTRVNYQTKISMHIHYIIKAEKYAIDLTPSRCNNF